MTAIELKTYKDYGTGNQQGSGAFRRQLQGAQWRTKPGFRALWIRQEYFLTIAGGLQRPTSGQVLIDGQDISRFSEKQRDEIRLNQIGFVLQSYNLLSYLSVADQFAWLIVFIKEILVRIGLRNCCRNWGSISWLTNSPMSFQADRISGSPLPVRCIPIRQLSWLMSQRPPWIVSGSRS